MSENPELEADEEQVDLDPDPAPEDGLGEDDFAPFDYTASYSEVDPNYVPIVDPGGEPDGGDEDLTDEEAEPPEEENELVPYWVSYELQGRNLDEGSAWQSLATEPFTAELEVEVEGLTAGARWEFRLRLVDRNGQRSRWSDPLQISLPTDFTPPPAPTAPDVDENNGYISSWWDGELTGQMPKDFSHIVKYLQQMHPEGDPEGEPGDPYRFSTLGDAGVFSVGFLLSGVLYRTWYTAVDTSGNESPWSDVVEFTPSSAFNTEELEEDLRKLNQETLPALEQSLTTKANEAAQAVEDFRTEWDESGWDPEAIDELKGRADATEAEVATAKAEAEQAKQDAATAQANAEALEGRADATDAEVAQAKADAAQAKQDAEAAQAKADALEEHQNHLEATLAEKASASELDELDDILRGTADLSNQVANKFYGNMAIVSRLQAEEGWIGGVALGDETVTARHVNMEDFTASQGFIDNAFVNLIQGKQADFEAAFIDSFIAESAAVAQELVVGFSDNLLPIEELIDFRDREFSSPSWRQSGAGRWRSITNQNGVEYLVRLNDGSPGDGESRLTYRLGGSGVHTKPGEKFSVKFYGWQASSGEGDGSNYFRLRYQTATGGYVGFGNRIELQSGWHDYTYTDTTPDGAYRAELIFQAYDGSPRGHWGDFEWHRVQGGHVAVQGLLQATTGELEELFFDEAVGNAISVGIANVITLNADRINSNSWSGQVMTGPIMQSHSASNRGWRIEPGDGLQMWDNNGGQTVRINGVDNFVSGTFSTDTSAYRGVTIDEDEISWTSLFGEVTTLNTPHIRLHRRESGASIEQSLIGVLNNGNLLISPGGGTHKMLWLEGGLNVGPTVVDGSVEVVNERGVGGLGGDFVIIGSGDVVLDRAGLYMGHTSASQPAGMPIAGARTYLSGRLINGHSPSMMFAWEEWGSFSMRSSSNYVSGTVTYGAPAPTGNRYPNLSVGTNSSSWSNYRFFAPTGFVYSRSSFRYAIYRLNGSGTATVYLEMLAAWN